MNRNNRKGGPASLGLRTCVKRNAVCGARFKGLSLYFLYQKGSLIRIKTGLDTYLIRIQTRTPLSRYPAYDYSNERAESCSIQSVTDRLFLLGAHQGGHATARFLEGFLEASSKEVLHGRVLRRRLVRASVGTKVLRGGCVIEGA